MKIRRREFLGGTLALGFATTVDGRISHNSAELRRDEYGIPYIWGSSDAACVFALGYAQAEDGLPHLEDNFIRSIGRAAEVHGERALQQDKLVRALEIPRLAREEYARATTTMRVLYDAYAAGVERYRRDSEEKLALLERIEPWHPLAFVRYKYHILEFLGYAGLDLEKAQFAPISSMERPQGSNAWALGPSRTRDGKAMLLINPHVSFFGPGIYYECDLDSDEGLRFHGASRFGFPLPYMGHNDRLGWGYTDNYHDHADLYVEHFDRPGAPLDYRYGDGYRRARQWTETIAVRRDDGTTVTQDHDFVATHHGPIVGSHDGKPLAVKLGKLAEGGWFDQWYAMLKARSLRDFRAALSMARISYMNVTYADADGNIYYVYNGLIPRRDERFDWSAPVDGSDPRTEWDGFHSLDELPQILNPESGFVQNCNSDPMVTTVGERPNGDYPSYMLGWETFNYRARRSHQILEQGDGWTFEDWQRAATDTKLYFAQEAIPKAIDAWDALDDADILKPTLATIVASLKDWDHRATLESDVTTIFVLWALPLLRDVEHEASILIHLADTKKMLEEEFGTWRVPWGDINRMQAAHWSGEESFSDERKSVPVKGASGMLGSIFTYYSGRGDGAALLYGNSGNSYVSVVEFGETGAKARAIRALGQSLREDSLHRFDQARLYGEGGFRNVHSPIDRERRTTLKKRLGALF